MKRRILLVDDEVTVLLTLKAVLEISGFDVHTAASAREGKSKIRLHQYDMVITDMRMENDAAGSEVIHAARTAAYHPAVALLTAFPVDEEGWDGVAPDKVLVKATQTRILLQQIEKLFVSHAAKLAKLSDNAAQSAEAMRKGQAGQAEDEASALAEAPKARRGAGKAKSEETEKTPASA